MQIITNGTKIWQPDKTVILPGAQIGDNCVIHGFCWIGNKVKIGKNCLIQAFTFIPDGVTIGDNVFIGPHVCFTNDKYPPSFGDHWATTTVEDGVSIGAGAVICPGLTIFKGAKIGAGAVVTKSITTDHTYVGNPARPLALKVVPHTKAS